jgi:hypothetical protein
VLALATYPARPDATPDDAVLVSALEARGLTVMVAPWDSLDPAHGGLEGVLLRSCWDYHIRLEAFLAWIAGLERHGVRLWNSASLVRWNARKQYLRDLASRGIPTVPTAWLDSADTRSLGTVLLDRGWDQAVVKPVVSASAHQTWRTSLATADPDDTRFRRLLSQGDVMVQPYLPAIESGEWSLVFLGGRYSHGVLKRPGPGEFRVQTQHGGRLAFEDPGKALVDTGAAVLHAAPERPLYARVDGCVVEGKFTLMELELIEPELFLGRFPRAAGRLADLLAAEVAGTTDTAPQA